jgi:PLP dependent protein
LFDYIHSLDNIKLANLLFKFEKILNKKRKYFIQVNLGKEKQKNGVDINNLDKFYKYCVNELQLNVIGLMAIPPNDGNENLYFKVLMELKDTLGLEELSIGMSGDFKIALKYNTTFVRIGSAIFGSRT